MRRPAATRLANLLALLAVGLFAIGATGCGETVEQIDDRTEQEKNAEPAPLNSKVFLSLDEAKQYRSDGALLIDTRPPEDYEAGHIPGAVHVHGGKPFKDDYGFLWENEAKLQEIARSFGLKRDQKVVIYGKSVDKRAGRLFWTLEYLGHGDVYLYAPGHEEIAGEIDAELETGESDPQTGDFVVAPRDSVYASPDEVEAIATGEKEGVLIDTRRETEYTGEEVRESEKRGGADPRQGYIPEAVHYHWEEMFTQEGQLESKSKLTDEFNDLGILDEDVVTIAYCQTGTRSAYVYAVLRWFGHDQAKNYDGSWVEWSRDEERPVAQTE